MNRTQVGLLCSCLVVPVCAAAQAAPAACDPVAPPAEVRQARLTLYGEIQVARGAAEPVRTYAALLLRALAYRLALPTPLKLAVWSNPLYDPADWPNQRDVAWVHPDLPLAAYLVINSTGTLRRLVLAQSTLVPAVDSAVLAPLATVADTAVLPAELLAGTGDSVTLYFATRIRADSSRGSAGLDSGTLAQPLARMLMPTVRLQRAPRLVEGDVEYPTRRGRHILADGQVRVQFAVGADGRVAPGTLRVRDATSPEFVEEAYEAVARLVFEPAKSGRCAIAMVVDQAFRFRHGFWVRAVR